MLQCVKNEKWQKIRDHRVVPFYTRLFCDLELASSHSSLSPRALKLQLEISTSIRILFLFLALFITGDGSPRDMLDLVTQ